MKYNIVFVSSDWNAEKQTQYFATWLYACKFMKSLLDDGYIILEVNG